MNFIVSESNGSTYTLDPYHQEDLMYAPIYADGSYEMNIDKYEFVEWEMIEDENDVVEEAARCHRELLNQRTV